MDDRPAWLRIARPGWPELEIVRMAETEPTGSGAAGNEPTRDAGPDNTSKPETRARRRPAKAAKQAASRPAKAAKKVAKQAASPVEPVAEVADAAVADAEPTVTTRSRP